jgi:hypothetical protein
MTEIQTPSEVHAQFDSICAQLTEFEPLPTVVAKPPAQTNGELDHEEQTAPLDALILAGLIAPY